MSDEGRIHDPDHQACEIIWHQLNSVGVSSNDLVRLRRDYIIASEIYLKKWPNDIEILMQRLETAAVMQQHDVVGEIIQNLERSKVPDNMLNRLDAAQKKMKKNGNGGEVKCPIVPKDNEVWLKNDGMVRTNGIGIEMVAITQRMWAGKYEVRQKHYELVMGENPSRKRNDQNPVEMVSWYDAIRFCRRLTECERSRGVLPEGWEYSLPTKAEWNELLGNATWENAITSNMIERKGPEPVGARLENNVGLSDVYGNVWEWCEDWETVHHKSAQGGSWNSIGLTMDDRTVTDPRYYDESIGFRVVLRKIECKRSDP